MIDHNKHDFVRIVEREGIRVAERLRREDFEWHNYLANTFRFAGEDIPCGEVLPLLEPERAVKKSSESKPPRFTSMLNKAEREFLEDEEEEDEKPISKPISKPAYKPKFVQVCSQARNALRRAVLGGLIANKSVYRNTGLEFVDTVDSDLLFNLTDDIVAKACERWQIK